MKNNKLLACLLFFSANNADNYKPRLGKRIRRIIRRIILLIYHILGMSKVQLVLVDVQSVGIH